MRRTETVMTYDQWERRFKRQVKRYVKRKLNRAFMLSLIHILFPQKTLKKIKENVFYGCSSLKEFTIPEEMCIRDRI